MKEVLDRGKTLHVMHQFLHAFAGFFNHPGGRADDPGGGGNFGFINAGRLPRFYRQYFGRECRKWIDSRNVYCRDGGCIRRCNQGMFLDLYDQAPHLGRDRATRRALQECIQSLYCFLIATQPGQRFSPNQLRRTGCGLPLPDCELGFFQSFFVALLVKMGVGEQTMREPRLRIHHQCLLQHRSCGRIILALKLRSSQKGERLTVPWI